jgi:hypothetical protein
LVANCWAAPAKAGYLLSPAAVTLQGSSGACNVPLQIGVRQTAILQTSLKETLTPSLDLPKRELVFKYIKKPDKPAAKSSPSKEEKGENKAESKPAPLPPVENVIDVTTNQLVDKPQEFLNKNIKFSAKFFAYSSLALDYKPAMRSSRTNLSFLILRPEAHVPFAEIKLAMALPKEKDPETTLLASLKDGDQIEVIGKVFATPLDEPWIDVLRLKKLSSADDSKKDDKKLSANETDATKKENIGELDGIVKGKILPDKGQAFPPDTGSKGSKIAPNLQPTNSKDLDKENKGTDSAPGNGK